MKGRQLVFDYNEKRIRLLGDPIMPDLLDTREIICEFIIENAKETDNRMVIDLIPDSNEELSVLRRKEPAEPQTPEIEFGRSILDSGIIARLRAFST